MGELVGGVLSVERHDVGERAQGRRRAAWRGRRRDRSGARRGGRRARRAPNVSDPGTVALDSLVPWSRRVSSVSAKSASVAGWPLSHSSANGEADVVERHRPAGGAVEGRAGESVEKERGVVDAAAQRPRGILAAADGHDPVGGNEADGRLEADAPVERARAGDRAVGLGADRERRQAAGDRGTGSRRRPACAAIERPRVAREPSDGRPATRRAGRADVGPLGQVRGAEDDEPGLAQARDERCVAHDGAVGECE